MFQQLVNHNPDLARLVQRGYAVSIDSGCLVVRDVPYLDSASRPRVGALVAKLVFVDQLKVAQDDHQILFAGDVPYGLLGEPIPNLGGGPVSFHLKADDVVVQRSFSNKPQGSGKFSDLFEKIESYVRIISGPAMEKYDVTPFTFRSVENSEEQSVFLYQDTLSSRSGTGDLMSAMADDVVAIIGLGGTGSYLLDYLVKTPVKEIRAFDPDVYHVHNAFRSPGRLTQEDLGKAKTEVFKDRYSNFRNGLVFKDKFVDLSCKDDFDGVTFAFVCVDSGTARSGIFELLISKNIPFIDVGMGMRRIEQKIGGMLRATYFPSSQGFEVLGKNLVEVVGHPEDLYSTNIQISELNAMNACLAVIRYKQIRGFYVEDEDSYHALMNLSDFRISRLTMNPVVDD